MALGQQYNARLIPIRHEEFTHGRSLNLGMSHACGALVLICSAHWSRWVPIFLKVVAPFTDLAAAVRCLATIDSQQLGEWYQTWMCTMTLGKSREPPRLVRVAEAVSFRDVLRYSASVGTDPL